MYSIPGVNHWTQRPQVNYPEYTCLHPNRYLDRRCGECPDKAGAKCPRNGWDYKRRRKHGSA